MNAVTEVVPPFEVGMGDQPRLVLHLDRTAAALAGEETANSDYRLFGTGTGFIACPFIRTS